MMAKSKVAMLLFLSSESVFFAILILSFIYFRGSPLNAAGATPKSLDPGRTGIFTACLLSSSLTVWLGGRCLRRGNHVAGRLWLLATVILGAVFLFGQGREYLRLIDANITISRDVFASAFFTLTGFHGLHVFVGLIALAILLGLAQGGDFKRGANFEAVTATSLYWHFVDAVWIVIFSVVYLWTLL